MKDLISWILMGFGDLSGRSNRREFWVKYLVASLFSIGLPWLWILSPQEIWGIDLKSRVLVIGLICSLSIYYFIIFPVTIRRLHDIGLSGWWFTATLIPIIGSFFFLWFSLWKGQPKENKYGEIPPKLPPSLKPGLEFDRVSRYANRGNVESQAYVGYCYTAGYQVDKDIEKGLFWLRKAAESGNSAAHAWLLLSLFADRKTINDTEIQWWLSKLSETEEISDFIFRSLINDKLPTNLLFGLAEKDHLTAQAILGKELIRQDSTNLDEGLRWLKKSAENGNAIGQFLLACEYLKLEDYQNAMFWSAKATDQNVGPGLLGHMYYHGLGVQQNYEIAVKWLTKSAMCGSRSSRFLLAQCYISGNGVVKNHVEAYRWLLLAKAESVLSDDPLMVTVNFVDSDTDDKINELENILSREEIIEGQRLAKAFTPDQSLFDRDIRQLRATLESYSKSKPKGHNIKRGIEFLLIAFLSSFLTGLFNDVNKIYSDLQSSSNQKRQLLFDKPILTDRSDFVTISGMVNDPKQIPFTDELTILGAIDAAGGIKPGARGLGLKLKSFGHGEMSISIEDILQDPKRLKLAPGDKIRVTESFIPPINF